MTPNNFYDLVMLPGIDSLPESFYSPEASLLLMAIAGQESNWAARVQQDNGPAHGYWQCEAPGAVLGVLSRQETGPLIRAFCNKWDIPTTVQSIWEAIAYQDRLAYMVARLALWLDPLPLPKAGDLEGAWVYYRRVWRPGKPRLAAWPKVYDVALSATGDKTPWSIKPPPAAGV